MKIVIVGGGLVGTTLAERLTRDQHDITLVDDDVERARKLSETLDVHVVRGNGAVAGVLRRAGAETADLVIAMSNSDEVNMIVGMLSLQLFDVPRIVVRLQDPGMKECFDFMAKDRTERCVYVNPDQAAADRIAQLLEVPGAMDVVSFMDGQLLVAGFRIGESSDLAGLRVEDMNLVLFAKNPTKAVAIHRMDDWIIPHGNDQIEVDDLVYFAIDREHLEGMLALVDVHHDDRRDLMIAGAGAIGQELVRRLGTGERREVLIEENEAIAKQAAETLPGAIVLHGRVTDQALLEEEDIQNVSTFVAVTPDHETNLVAGFLAKRLGAGRVVALVDNPDLVPLVSQIGIDAIISPRVLVIGLTLEQIRGGRIRSVAQLLEDRIEIVDVEASPRTVLTSGTLSEIKLPSGVLVAALLRDEKLLLPGGSDRIEPGDRVLLITTTENAPKLDDFLAE